jgi:hypothetical protein
MRNSRTLIAGLILIILAGLVAWKFLRPDTATGQSMSMLARPPVSAGREISTPQAVAPRELADETVSQTHNASVESTPPGGGARLDLHSIRACHEALLSKRVLETLGDCDKTSVVQASDAQACRDQLARVAKRANDALASAGSCPPDLISASAYYEAIKELAVRGDIPAQRCFITGYFPSAIEEAEESPMRKDQVDEYRGLARKFIDEGLERGDWSVVRWLAKMRTGLQDGMLEGAYPFGSYHPETAYRMNYLLMLGNQHNFEESIDARQLIEGWQPDKNLPQAKLKEAQDWAHNMYDQHFNGSQEGASLTQMCEH